MTTVGICFEWQGASRVREGVGLLQRLAQEANRPYPCNTLAQVRSVVHGSFHLERRYDAPVDRVWRALTDEAAKRKWFVGPPGEWELLERHMDVHEGGLERAKGRWKSGVVSTFDAIDHDVVLHERLVYSYVMYLNDKNISVSLATMQLKSEDGGTKLMVTEQGAFLDGYHDAGSPSRQPRPTPVGRHSPLN